MTTNTRGSTHDASCNGMDPCDQDHHHSVYHDSLESEHCRGCAQTGKAEHTAGPWEIQEVGAGELFVVKPDGEGGSWGICEMSNDNDWTNARLIAAAPALLEALRAILIASGNLDGPSGLPFRYDPTYQQARAAIKLVEGEK